MKHIQEFEQMPIWKLLLKYSIPSIVATSVHAVYNIVDRIYIGKGLGTDALAGVTLTFPIFILSIAIGVLLGNGSSSIISLRLGQKRFAEAEHSLGNVFGLFIIMGIVVSAVLLLSLDPLLRWVGATETTLPYARTYLLFFLPFMMFDFLAMGTNGCIRSEGNPGLAMRISIFGALLNIVLDPLFLFVFHWGVAGIALATSLSRLATAACVVWHFTRNSQRTLTLHWSQMRPQWTLLSPMIAIGLSPFLMNLATTFVAIFCNRSLLHYGGDMAIAAMGAIQSIFVMIETPLRGLMMGSQPIVGYNYGASLWQRVKQAINVSYVYSLMISLIGIVLICGFANPLVSMFSKNDPELVKMGANGLRIFLSMIWAGGLHMMTVMYFQASGKPKQAIMLNLSRKVVFFLPLLWILPSWFHLDGVWLATPGAELLASLLAGVFMLKEQKHLMQKVAIPVS